ncbi:hypothetical protein L211DRAFT_853829 [Terfezia boudieri ATCC MYA-4762]|uniref:Uncharacterized protein n=1 Tax=Terfezia boudieri ATCC MYA-4762 TaxID=1051890 RepID=A0A3N4LAI4_9PEZI|nr:hypothetical protein L211DRAFT_853829 [Terfezia boudieri ATCC MYA-4762]
MVEGKGGWKALTAYVLVKGDLERALAVTEAECYWRQASEVRFGALRGLEVELKEVKEQLALLAVSLGVGIVEEQAKVQRTISARKGRVEEENRKEKELKKIEAKRRETEAKKKRELKAQEEAEKVAAQARTVRESQQRAWDACEEALGELARKDRAALNEDELIGLGLKIKEARAMKRVTAKPGTGDFADESIWSVSKVAQDVDPLKVVGEVGRLLIQVFGRTDEMLNVWVEEGSSVKMIALSAPMTTARDRKALARKLREENKDIRGGKRMPKPWGGARVTGFTFDTDNVAEAVRLVKTGIMWDGKRRKVALFDQGKATLDSNKATATVIPTGPRGWRLIQGQHGPAARAIQCHNYGGWGHVRGCTSGRGGTFGRGRTEGSEGRQVEKEKVDEEGFRTVVDNRRKGGKPEPEGLAWG